MPRALSLRLGAGAIAASTLAMLPTFLVSAPPSAADESAIVDCQAALRTLPPNDDGSSPSVATGFPLNFFGATYTSLFVNNNGNVTFERPMSTFTPFQISATTPPVIAPFLADVDTRGGNTTVGDESAPVGEQSAPVGEQSGPRSGLVQYGQGTAFNRPAFCVNWFDVNGGVGYFSSHIDKRNTFQLVLVDRGDRAAGDFDIYFNYKRIEWETGDASGGRGGFGGTSAGVGYAAGDGEETHYLELPGSRVPGSFPDVVAGGAPGSAPLSQASVNSIVPGRLVFAVRGGGEVGARGVSGTVTDAGTGAAVADALVQVCQEDQVRCVGTTRSGAEGGYAVNGIREGRYQVRVFPPDGTTYSSASELVTVAAADVVVDVALSRPQPPPPGTSISGSSPAGTTSDGLPRLVFGQPLSVETRGCVGATEATYTIRYEDGTLHATGPLVETGPGVYAANGIAPFERTGRAEVTLRVVCGTETTTTGFDVYIDPSGFIRQVDGTPIVGARVVLERSDASTGPFTQVPDGSTVMSPGNRRNPDVTDATGHFGWDVLAGYYRVTASAPGCHAPGEPNRPTVQTRVYEIPPPVFDIDLRLECPVAAPVGGGGDDVGDVPGPPVVVTTASPTPNASASPSPSASAAPSASSSASPSGTPASTPTLAPTGAAPTSAAPTSAAPRPSASAPSCVAPALTAPASGTAGRPVDVVVRGAAGQSFRLLGYARPRTTLTLLRSGRLPASGATTLTLRPTGTLRLHVQDPGCPPTSGSVVVKVAAVSSIGVAPAAKARTLVFAGRVLPQQAGRAVQLFRTSPTGPVLTAVTTTRADGSWRIVRTFTGTGKQAFFAALPGDVDAADGATRAVAAVVR